MYCSRLSGIAACRSQPHLGSGLLFEAELTLQALATAHGAGHGTATLDLGCVFRGGRRQQARKGEARVDRWVFCTTQSSVPWLVFFCQSLYVCRVTLFRPV